MNTSLLQWAIKYGVGEPALQELREMFGTTIVNIPRMDDLDKTEAYTQSLIRLESGKKRDIQLFRNNVGVLRNPETGQPVRYGLANDTKAVNDKTKSGDLIGWRSIVITPSHVGMRLAQFLSRECKRPNWKWSGTERELAQLNWAQMVVAAGGDACFATGEGTL